MGKVFYVKNIEGEVVVFKEDQTPNVHNYKVDMFLRAHGVQLWFYHKSDNGMEYWSYYRDITGIWRPASLDEIPKILRMRQLTGAI